MTAPSDTPLDVCCALVTLPSANGPLLLAAKKAAGTSNGLLYEFPGGKLEPGESAQDAIVREIREELGCIIRPAGALSPVLHEGMHRTIRLIPFLCELAEATPLPLPLEHESLGFFTAQTVTLLPWAPADRTILAEWLAHPVS